MAMMKAVRIHKYGGPEVLVYEDAPRPEPAQGEILVRVYAAAVNPLDWKVRSGSQAERLHNKLPLILGWDMSGVVESPGAGVKGPQAGTEVFARLDTTRDGAYAEFAVCDARILAKKPSSFDHVHAASAPLASLTAWQALFEAGKLEAGQRVLIHGAAGAVGGFAVQFAKQKGAWVAGAAKKADIKSVSDLGADEAVDYDAGPLEQQIAPVDVVLDVIGGEIQERSLKVIRAGDILVSTVGINVAGEAQARKIEAKGFFVRSDGEQLSEISRMIDAGRLKLRVGTVLPLEKAREAHELAESGHATGKVVLKVRD